MSRHATPSRPATSGRGLRRPPSQARARQTLQAIFEATARVLTDEGEAALTTNRIAEVAGVSIGTLYQYFDNKEAIVRTMLQDERQRVMQGLEALLAAADPRSTDPARADPRRVLRDFIHLYVQAFGTGARGRRELVRLAWLLDRQPEQLEALRDASERIAVHVQRMNHPALRAPTPAMSFVLTRLLAMTVRAAAVERSPLLGTAAFEDELFNACWGVLSGGRPG